jgi:catechol 2,3-dioxygenase-like lactoylglutathione lyase family enzyme/predicted kinase
VSSLVIVSGSAGTGKTTIARELATRSPKGVHIVSDEFYYFIPDLIAPMAPESADQNTTVLTAVARAAAAYAAGGYDVFLDGVVGRWYLPLFERELAQADFAVDYILLRTSLEEALDRVAERNAPEMDAIVRKLHDQFADVADLERHVVDTHGRNAEEIVDEISRRQTAGDFRLDLRRRPINFLGELAIRVDDLPKMRDFYENVVGLEIFNDDFLPEFVFFKAGEAVEGHPQILGMFDRPRSADRERKTLDHFAFVIDLADHDSEKERLEGLGVTVVPRTFPHFHWRGLFFADPEGNTVELVCYDPTVT